MNEQTLIYPLMVVDRMAGVLVLRRWADRRPFRQADLEKTAALAAPAVLALENLRLLQQAVSNERLAAIGQLAAGVAHEIKNPVAYLDASLESLKEMLSECEARGGSASLWAEIKSVLADGLEGSGRIRDIVGDLKNMSRADSGRVRVDLNEVVRAALRISAAEVRHRAKVVLELGNDVAIQADPGRLSQVLVNLLVNSAQAIAEHAGKGGVVTVRTWRDGATAKFSVSDNGPGIAPENHARVFESFFTTKAPGAGTGLGLPISRDIVRAHGGELELQSARGEGACFVATLPLAAEEKARAA
jgi:signal transduction histidine kinase